MVNHLSTFFRFRLKILLDEDLDHLLLGDHRSYDYAVGISSVLDPEWERGPHLENLETHLFTCEIFECNKCGLRGKSMKDIIKHGETEHPEYKSRWIDHIKMDRKNYTEVSTKGYWSDEI